MQETTLHEFGMLGCPRYGHPNSRNAHVNPSPVINPELLVPDPAPIMEPPLVPLFNRRLIDPLPVLHSPDGLFQQNAINREAAMNRPLPFGQTSVFTSLLSFLPPETLRSNKTTVPTEHSLAVVGV